jgi:hypothetical protein
VNAISAIEDDGSVMITVTRIGGGNGEVSVGYITSDGSATEGADYAFRMAALSSPTPIRQPRRSACPSSTILMSRMTRP